MKAIKGMLAICASLFVTSVYAAPSAAEFDSLFGTTIIYVVLSVWAMILSNWFASEENGGDANIAAFLAAMAAGLGFVVIVALPVSLANFAAVLAGLVIATLGAFFACASCLTRVVDRKVYVISTIVFYVAMAAGAYIAVFGL